MKDIWWGKVRWRDFIHADEYDTSITTIWRMLVFLYYFRNYVVKIETAEEYEEQVDDDFDEEMKVDIKEEDLQFEEDSYLTRWGSIVPVFK